MTLTDKPSASPTGTTFSPPEVLTRVFDKYRIKILVTASGQFLDVIEVQVDKDFRTQKQRRSAHGSHDVSDLYEV